MRYGTALNTMSQPYAAERIGTDFFTALFASSAIGVAVWSEERRVVGANGSLREMFRLGATDETTFEAIVGAERRASFDELLRDVAANEASRTFELTDARAGARVVGAALGV